ncbi:30S ribosome-binding factor RbfA [candidate division WOR-3 bacterium]|nr:30S ribosome-binding factor RbfA [candidate division WOR-3 bacterium]
MQYRDKRVADAIRDTVADIILNKLSDPCIGFVTVTRCSVSRDLRNATVFVSVMGADKVREATVEHLDRARSYIRRLVGQRVKLKFLPELRFKLDDVLAHEQRVGEILDTLRTGTGPQDEPPAA